MSGTRSLFTAAPLTVAMALIAAAGGPAAAADAPVDTTRGGSMLEELQRRDLEFFSEELWEFDDAASDSALRELEALGFEAFSDSMGTTLPHRAFRIGIADRLIAYNRVEEAVAGLAVSFAPRGAGGAALDVQGAYASGPQKLRRLAALTIPIAGRGRRRRPAVELGAADRVVAFGSNAPTANALRMLIGAADERDYLRSEGGWAGASWPAGEHADLAISYEAARESSVMPTTDFSFFGNHQLLETNAPIDEGIDRAVSAGIMLGSLARARQQIAVTQRIGGGGLGGDFDYNRVDVSAAARRFLVANHEAIVEIGYARAAGSPPRQRMPDAGGLSTVRGHDRRRLVSRSAVHARVEILLPYNLLRALRAPILRDFPLQLAPWADWARAWDGGFDEWIASAGLGAQLYLGPFGRGSFVRLDTAFPIGANRPDDVRYHLYLARGLF